MKSKNRNRPEKEDDSKKQAEDAAAPDHEHQGSDEAEQVRSGSQTAQDRDHTIRGGDNRTGPMKEFPT